MTSRKRRKAPPINGARALMADRKEPDDSLDFFPTPPWATRALLEHVFTRLGFLRQNDWAVWEPACGECHMAEVLKEYFGRVHTSDIHPYGNHELFDFLSSLLMPKAQYDWIITNPPFTGNSDRGLGFTLRALDLARIGVAIFCRTQWAIEGKNRYETLFKKRPPTLFAPFVERVPLHRGRWKPAGIKGDPSSTATAYCWLVWVHGRDPMPPFWIPPGQRVALTKPDDRERFASWSLPQKEAAE